MPIPGLESGALRIHNSPTQRTRAVITPRATPPTYQSRIRLPQIDTTSFLNAGTGSILPYSEAKLLDFVERLYTVRPQLVTSFQFVRRYIETLLDEKRKGSHVEPLALSGKSKDSDRVPRVLTAREEAALS